MTGYQGGGLFDRSHTQARIPNNSNIGSFAAHKADKNDKTNASHNNPMLNWLEDGKAAGKNRRRGSQAKKGKD